MLAGAFAISRVDVVVGWPTLCDELAFHCTAEGLRGYVFGFSNCLDYVWTSVEKG